MKMAGSNMIGLTNAGPTTVPTDISGGKTVKTAEARQFRGVPVTTFKQQIMTTESDHLIQSPVSRKDSGLNMLQKKTGSVCSQTQQTRHSDNPRLQAEAYPVMRAVEADKMSPLRPYKKTEDSIQQTGKILSLPLNRKTEGSLQQADKVFSVSLYKKTDSLQQTDKMFPVPQYKKTEASAQQACIRNCTSKEGTVPVSSRVGNSESRTRQLPLSVQSLRLGADQQGISDSFKLDTLTTERHKDESQDMSFQMIRSPQKDVDETDGTEKVKVKLMSMWNNMKYGWTVKMKTNFAKDSPVWLLGCCYHRKQESSSDKHAVSLSGQQPSKIPDDGIEAFHSDFVTRIWLTYRREFPMLNRTTFTTDCGWGCMIRSGQMLLAQALVMHFLGRGWRWKEDQPITNAHLFNQNKRHRMIIRCFGDSPIKCCPLSLHQLVSLGEILGKKAGDWYGPASVAHILKKAVEMASPCNPELNELCVYVAQDCTVYIQDIIEMCSILKGKATSSNNEVPKKVSNTSVHHRPQEVYTEYSQNGLDKKLSELNKKHHNNEQETSSFCDSVGEKSSDVSLKDAADTKEKDWKALVILVPVRLGGEQLNPIYVPIVKELITLDCCIGIIGGKPRHSLYFVGYQDDKLIHLDPHYCQEVVDVWNPEFPTSSFHCSSPRKISISRMDPSCCIGFYCRTRHEFEEFAKKVVSLHQQNEYPLFIISEGKNSDFESSIHVNFPSESFSPQSQTSEGSRLPEEELESEEFVFL